MLTVSMHAKGLKSEILSSIDKYSPKKLAFEYS